MKFLTTKNEKGVAKFIIRFTKSVYSSHYPSDGKETDTRETTVTYIDKCGTSGAVSFDSYTLLPMETSILRPTSENIPG